MLEDDPSGYFASPLGKKNFQMTFTLLQHQDGDDVLPLKSNMSPEKSLVGRCIPTEMVPFKRTS